MNYHRVPNWHIGGDQIPLSPEFMSNSGALQPDDSDVQELIWRDGKLAIHTYSQKSPRPSTATFPGEFASFSGGLSKHAPESHVVETTLASSDPLPPYVQEDELASWLHYPLDDGLYRDLFLPPGDRNAQAAVSRLPEPGEEPADGRAPDRPRNRDEAPKSALRPRQKVVNFSIFAQTAGLVGAAGQVRTGRIAGGSEKHRFDSTTVVDSCDTPPQLVSRSLTETMEFSKDQVRSASERHETTMASSRLMNRKRKAGDSVESESHSEDADVDESVNREAKKYKSKRRNRAATTHNLSERRRRDRINEKMRSLQELLPRCNKSDKASLLDEAIEYLKTLQLQVQIMSMGCSMAPHMMFPGHHQCMTPMGMAMSMGMVAGPTRPALPFSPIIPAAAQLYPSLPVPGVHHMQLPLCAKNEAASGGLDPQLNPTEPTTLAEYQQCLRLQVQVPPQISLPSDPSGSKCDDLLQSSQ